MVGNLSPRNLPKKLEVDYDLHDKHNKCYNMQWEAFFMPLYYNNRQKVRDFCSHETTELPRHHKLEAKPTPQMEIAVPYLVVQWHLDL